MIGRTIIEKGFSVIEILVTLAIVSILAVIISNRYSDFRETQSLSNTVEEVIALIDEAHSRTLAGDNATTYSVRLETNKAVLFVGTTYSSGASTNKTINIDSVVNLASITLAGGGQEIKFDALTGDTSQYGTFVVKLASSTTGQKTITVSKTGFVSSN